MTSNRAPTSTELDNVAQDTVHWPAKAFRVTTIDSDGNEVEVATEGKQDVIIANQTNRRLCNSNNSS